MKLFFSLMVLFSVSSYAGTLSFKCDFTDETYINQFSLDAKTLDHENGEFQNVEFDFSVRSAGFNRQSERLVLTRDGKVQEFPAGGMYRHKTTRVFSVIKGAEVEYMNLLIDVPPQHSSHIRFANGASFFGSCRSL